MNKNTGKTPENTYVFDDISEEELQRELDELIASLKSDERWEISDEIEYEDASERFPDDAEVMRVELRRCVERPDKDIAKQKVKDEYIIGLLTEDELPQEGEAFQVYYHNENGEISLNHVHSHEPIFNVVQDNKHYFFSSGTVNWRLSLLDCGN